jgi:hypothetical protein
VLYAYRRSQNHRLTNQAKSTLTGHQEVAPGIVWSTRLHEGLPSTEGLFFDWAKRFNLDLTDLSERIGYDPGQISNWHGSRRMSRKKGTRGIPWPAVHALADDMGISDQEKKLWEVAHRLEETERLIRQSLGRIKNIGGHRLYENEIEVFLRAFQKLCISVHALRAHDSFDSEFAFFCQILVAARTIVNAFTSYAQGTGPFIDQSNFLQHARHPANLLTTEILNFLASHRDGCQTLGQCANDIVVAIREQAGSAPKSPTEGRIFTHSVHLIRRFGDRESIPRLQFMSKKFDDVFMRASCLMGAALFGDLAAADKVVQELLTGTEVGHAIAEYERVHLNDATLTRDGSIKLDTGRSAHTIDVLSTEMIGGKFTNRLIIRKLQVATLLEKRWCEVRSNWQLRQKVQELERFHRQNATERGVDRKLTHVLGLAREGL